VFSFTDSDLSDTDNIVPFEDTTSINLINLLSVLLFCPFILINQRGKSESVNDCTHTDQQKNSNILGVRRKRQ